jgi:sulfur carrier protein
MDILLNGQKTTINDATTVSSLVSNKCRDPQCVITEINEKIIKRENWDRYFLKNGDRVELVTFVGGG